MSTEPSAVPLDGWWKIAAGSVGGIALVAQAWLSVRAEASRTQARVERTVEFTDVLAPLVNGLKDIPRTGAVGDRRTSVATFVASALGGCTGLTDAKRTRATVYQVVNTGGTRTFVPWDSTGRGDRPVSEFLEGDGGEGEEVWMRAREGQERFVPDITTADLPHFDRTRVRHYRTFIPVPIILGGLPVGLLTINAPKPGDLVESDVDTMFAIADLIAAALRQLDGEFPPKGS